MGAAVTITPLAASESSIRIALAALRGPKAVKAGAARVVSTLRECREKQVRIACFPETYLPGLRGGAENDLPPPDQPALEAALEAIRAACADTGVAAIVGMEWKTKRGLENRAFVISGNGKVLGHQTKNQITPGGESDAYVADGKRRIFDISGVRIGVVICHEGWRYPETVRWAAVRGAKIVFQPQVTGSDRPGEPVQRKWGESFYEKAMECRAQENTVYFASVNQAMTRQNSATSLIAPDGKLVRYVSYGQEELLVADLDLTRATGFYAKRYQPDLYEEEGERK